MLQEVLPDKVIEGSRNPPCRWTNSARLGCWLSHANGTSRMQSGLVFARLAFELESSVRNLVLLVEHTRDSCPDHVEVSSLAEFDVSREAMVVAGE